MDVKNLSVKMQLVSDVNKPGTGARVVANPPAAEVKPRVDVKMEVETGGAFAKQAGSTTVATAGRAVGAAGQRVDVGAGGGVLGHLLKTATASSVPDPEKMSRAELKALLEPYFGRPVVVTNYDREESASLAEAVKGGDVADTHGVLVGVSDDGLQLKKDGKVNTVQSEYWALARIRLDDGDRAVLAQDPSYSKHFVD